MRSSGVSLFEKLSPGPGLAADQVAANQRARLCGAMLQLAAEHGFRSVTVRKLTALAGVSTRAFYQCFANTEECFAATYSRVVNDLLALAADRPVDGEDAVRACARTLLSALAENPRATRLVLVESQLTGPTARRACRGSVAAFERLIRAGFEVDPDPVEPPPRLVRAAAGAAMWIARSRLERQQHDVTATADGFAAWLLCLRDGRIERLPPAARTGTLSAVRLAPAPDPVVDDRRFLLTAATKLCTATGYEELTVPRIRREAGVSRRSFDANFHGVADCFLEAVESHTNRVVEHAAAQAREAGSWERAVVRAIAALCAGASRDPGLARLAFLEILAPGAEGLARARQIVTQWAERLRQSAPARRRPSPLAAEASVAATWTLAQCEILSGRGHRIDEAIPEMAFVLLAPAIGPAAAVQAIRTELASLSAQIENSTHN